ncbi:MAG: hypothetical protein ACJ8AW_48800 [Rhodopila sp.]
MNGKCAAGTARFLERIAGLLGYSLEELGERSLEAEKPIWRRKRRITPRTRFSAVPRKGREVIEPGGVADDVGQEAMPGPSDGTGCHLAVLSQPCRSGQRLQSDNARLLYAILLPPEPCAIDAPVPRSAGRPGSSPGQRALHGDALCPAPDSCRSAPTEQTFTHAPQGQRFLSGSTL